jgi:hypothetical protein
MSLVSLRRTRQVPFVRGNNAADEESVGQRQYQSSSEDEAKAITTAHFDGNLWIANELRE